MALVYRLFEVVKNFAGNQALREVVHAAKMPFRATIPPDMRTGSATESLNFEEIIGRMAGKESKCCGRRSKEQKKLFAKCGGYMHETGVIAEYGVRAFKNRCGLHERVASCQIENHWPEHFRQSLHDFCCLRRILFSSEQKNL